ncbi:CocE/NonD family hydrolase [Sphaerisporangium aureirubrum]|uniref:CocE/NonD family hydrolase n=1 Tax=Sphaerisporangium aureirubrum TaxID=1544736 RepID=A0ABW1NNH1_9ACTN
MSGEHVTIPLPDGTRLAATLYLPERLPAPCLLEALPYRKDDVTLGYRAEYEALAGHGYAVCRVDLRGTGSSEGVARDEYPPEETGDLCAVIAWLAARDWCDGGVGMYGTSYSGFNALNVAAARPPALRAVCSIYASDDRYTDDVHYTGGVPRWLDLVDYPAYMAAMNALPPVPGVYGDGWREEWLRRLSATEPWLPRWLAEQEDGPYWRQGSLRPRLGRIEVPTMLVAGWADGYGNVVPRLTAALERGGVPYRVVAGPWSHADPAHALPGPGIDLLPEMLRWWGRWLRGDTAAVPARSAVVFLRSSTPPSPDRPLVGGTFHDLPAWPAPPHRAVPLDGPLTGPGPARVLPGEAGSRTAGAPPAEAESRWVALPSDPGIGVAVWNTCAGALPWGQPLDQRDDDARSVTVEWEVPAEGLAIVGNPRLRVPVRAPGGGALAVRLCDVAPDGASELVTRGLLRLPAGDRADAEVELDVVAHRVVAGHRLRLALATAEWPNAMTLPDTGPVHVGLGTGVLLLPVAEGPLGPEATGLVHTPPPEPPETDGVVWTVERDVLGGVTRCRTGYGSSAETDGGGSYADRYEGEVTLDHRTRRQTATADTLFAITWPDGPAVTARSRVEVVADGGDLTVTVTVTATEDSAELRTSRWSSRVRGLPRK